MTITATARSTQILSDAIDLHIAITGSLAKTISINAGFEKDNYLSMLRSGSSKISLERIPALKRAVPCLDAHALTAARFDEHFPDSGAAEAMISLSNFLTQPDPFESAILSIAGEVSKGSKTAGLPLPSTIPDDLREQIKVLLHTAVQREAAAVFAD